MDTQQIAEAAAVAILRELRQEADEYRLLWDEDEEILRLVRRELSRALYGYEDDEPFLDDGLVGELRRVVDTLLELRGEPLDVQ